MWSAAFSQVQHTDSLKSRESQFLVYIQSFQIAFLMTTFCISFYEAYLSTVESNTVHLPGKSIPVLFTCVKLKKALIVILLEINFNGAIALLNISSNLTRKNSTKMYIVFMRSLFDVHREYLISQAKHLNQNMRITKNYYWKLAWPVKPMFMLPSLFGAGITLITFTLLLDNI